MSRRAMMTAAAILVAACGGAGPTGPSAPETFTLNLDFGRIEVIDDCDGVEGDGDFSFRVETYASPLDEPEVIFSKSLTLGPGGTSDFIGHHAYTIVADSNSERTVAFTATEYDKNIFGTTYADSRLDHAHRFVSHLYTNGSWNTLGQESIVLGTSGCQVRLGWVASVESH